MTETDASRQADLFASLKRGTRIVLAAGTLLLAACQSIVPKGPAPVTPTGPTGPTGPDVTQGLPTDTLRHRVALLVPMSGPNAAVGQSIANATTLALMDTRTDKIRITTYDTAPGPIATRAASGIDRFDELLERAAATVPQHQLVTIEDVGGLAAFLVSDAGRHITGTIIPVDGGQHLLG